jgi:hypothetical protein
MAHATGCRRLLGIGKRPREGKREREREREREGEKGKESELIIPSVSKDKVSAFIAKKESHGH